MKIRIFPSEVWGAVAAPPSKSMAHRLLILAGLAEGESRISGIAPSEDVLATIDCLRALGAEIRVTGDEVTVRGTDPFRAEAAELFCRESGSTLRFLIPLCLLSGREMRLSGSETLFRRPLSVYEELCEKQGISFRKGSGELLVQGQLSAGAYELDGGVSSQFISGLLFALPLLPEGSRIRLKPPVESRAYIDLTLSALRKFGVRADWNGENVLEIPGGQRPAAGNKTVEGDWSNAAFFLAMGAEVTGLDDKSLQSDRICTEYFRQLETADAALDLSGCPDLAPVLFSCAALRHGGRFTGTRRLAIKESDRGNAMREELSKFGVPVEVGENEITVGCGIKPPSEILDGHNDHRIVMALTVLLLKTGGVIDGAEAVKKSFPDFFEKLRQLGVKLETEG